MLSFFWRQWKPGQTLLLFSFLFFSFLAFSLFLFSSFLFSSLLFFSLLFSSLLFALLFFLFFFYLFSVCGVQKERFVCALFRFSDWRKWHTWPQGLTREVISISSLFSSLLFSFLFFSFLFLSFPFFSFLVSFVLIVKVQKERCVFFCSLCLSLPFFGNCNLGENGSEFNLFVSSFISFHLFSLWSQKKRFFLLSFSFSSAFPIGENGSEFNLFVSSLLSYLLIVGSKKNVFCALFIFLFRFAASAI